VSNGVRSVPSDTQSSMPADMRFALPDDTQSAFFQALKNTQISRKLKVNRFYIFSLLWII
jgi:hypothetical protein